MKRKSVVIPFILLLFTVGCGQSFNSNTQDFNLTAFSSCADPSDTLLCEANEIIQNNCTNCHTNPSIHAAWGGWDTNEEWIQNGRILPGNADGSRLIIRLKNYGGDMPEGAPAISNADAEKIRTWINSL